MKKGDLAIDPRGMIFESYRIDGIVMEECRAIFLDWALGVPAGEDMQAALETLWTTYAKDQPDHPMSRILAEGLERAAKKPARRRGRAARR